MAEQIRWGILATGSIARQFGAGLPTSKTGVLQAVGSRTLESASKFATQFGGKPYASYEEVLADPEVDAVYIATPHHLHAEWTIKAAQAGKAILCEKPFTLNAIEAEKALAEVKKAGVFFMEGFMYRVHPQTLKVKELIQSGAIGRPLVVNAEFGFAAGRDWNNFRADGALGGGGLMDVGSYCTTFAQLVAGEEAISASYMAEITEKGYDAFGSGSLKYPSGLTASFGTGIHANLTNDARVYGESGQIHVSSPWKCSSSTLTLKQSGKEDQTFDFDSSNDELYGIEADAVAAYITKGENPNMSIEETLMNMRTLDKLRASAGLVFAAEPKA
jgi:predicted dehydrogenase